MAKRTIDRRTAAVAAAVAAGAALLPSAVGASPTGTAPPAVVVSALPGSVVTIPQCDGEVVVQESAGVLKVERPGDSAGTILVDVTYSGSLVPGTDYEALPDPVEIPAGQEATFLEVKATTPGWLNISVEPGAGYVVGRPSSATSNIVDSGGDFGCQDEVYEVILLGTAPTPLPIYDEFGFGVGDSTLVMSGDVPPGLTYGIDGSWSGVATELGPYEFTACYQIGDVCGLEIPFRILVVDEARPAPLPLPTPATPVQGQPDFTG